MYLLLAMIFVMPFEASPYLHLSDNLLGIFPDFTVIKLLGLLGFAWAAIQLASGHPAIRLLASPIARLFLLFFAGVVFAGLLHGTGFAYAISRYLAFLLFMPFVLVSVRSQADFRKVFYAIVLAELIVFPYGVRQMIRFGERLGIGLYETNYLAAILVFVIPLAFVIAFQQRERTRRVLWTLGAFVLVLMVFLTSSRGGFLGLLVAGMVFVYRQRGLGAALGVMLALLVGVFVLPTDLGSRTLDSLFGDEGEVEWGLEYSNRAHVALFWAALRMIADNPLLGVGPLNFKDLSTLYTGLPIANIAHNSFLEIAAEFGIPMLVVFVLLLAATFRTLNRVVRLGHTPELAEIAGWAEGVRSGLIGFLVSACFISAQYEKILWLAIFLTIVLGWLADRRLAEVAEAEEPEPAETVAGLDLAPETSR